MPDAPETPVTELKESLRVKLPDTFSGNRRDLETWLLQVELYQHFNDDKFPSAESYCIWTTSYLRGEAMVWIEPFLRDYFDNEDTCGAMMTTQSMFGGWSGFKREIRRMFGDIDARKTAETHLFGLKQTGSVVAYATEFQRHANKTGWNSQSLLSHYRRGLKDDIRLELTRVDPQPHDIIALIEQSVRIGNRIHEFKREQRSFGGGNHQQKGGYRPRHEKPRENRWSDPMELDATFRKGRGKPRQGGPSKEVMDKRRKEKLCFECGLPGHMASSHRQKKPWSKERQANAMGRGGYNGPVKECNASYRQMTVEQLEEYHIHTQLEEALDDSE
jgi:hypothetical protein